MKVKVNRKFVPNPHGLLNRERLKIVGGPDNGSHARAQLILGLPASCLKIGTNWYELDAANRQWKFMKVKP